MAIDVPRVAAPPQAPPFITAPESAEFDQRWAAWQSRGAAHEGAVRRKLAVVAPILIFIAAVIMYALLGR